MASYRKNHLEHGLFQPRYYKKIGRGKDARYFYSKEEYEAYVNRAYQSSTREAQLAEADRQKRQERDREVMRQYNQASRNAQIAEANRQKRLEADRATMQQYNEASRGAQLYNNDKVGVIDYVTGGTAGKIYRQTKQKYKQAMKAAKKAEKAAAKAKAKMEKYERKYGPYSRGYKKYQAIYEEQSKLAEKYSSNVRIYAKNVETAQAEYYRKTLVGNLKSGGKNLRNMLKRFGNKAVRTINTPIIKTGQKKK